MLGDSMRRRQKARRGSRRERRRSPRGRRRSGRGRRLLIALGVGLVAFTAGYLIAVQVLFPVPAGPDPGVPVPELAGRSVADARDLLREAGLSVEDVVRVPAADERPGSVVAQGPVAGQRIRRGSGVRLAVAAASERLVIPDVIGFDADVAADLLTVLGFQVDRATRSSPEPDGRVLALRPEPGEERALPARVELVVSTGGPEPVRIPPDSLAPGLDSIPLPALPADTGPGATPPDTVRMPAPDTARAAPDTARE